MNEEYLPQTVTEIQVTDFMGIDGTITLLPSGNLLTVMGPNGAGKSSFIHALEECFDPQGVKGIAHPIHDGKDEARVKITTTQAIIERVWKKNGPGLLTAKALDGAAVDGGAKKFLATITGGMLFDPDDFLRLEEKDQRALLLSKVTLPFNLDDVDAKRAGFYTTRTDVSRKVKELTAQLKGCDPLDESLPPEQVASADLYAEKDAIREHNAEVERLASAHAAATNARIAADQAGRDAAAALDRARANHKAAAVAEKTAADAAAGTSVKTTDAVDAQLASIDETNTRVRAQIARALIATALAKSAAEETALNASMAAIDKQKADALAAADFPAGLSLNGDVIMYGDLVFRDCNKGTRDTIALDLATAANPALKIVVMKSGNDLDDASMAYVQKLVDERKYFVIMERIHGGGNQSIGFSLQTPAVTA